jgi:hypothetical protein
MPIKRSKPDDDAEVKKPAARSKPLKTKEIPVPPPASALKRTARSRTAAAKKAVSPAARTRPSAPTSSTRKLASTDARPARSARRPASARTSRKAKRPRISLGTLMRRIHVSHFGSCMSVALPAIVCIVAILLFPRLMASSSAFENVQVPSTLSLLPALSDNIGSGDTSSAGVHPSLPTPLHFKVQGYIDHYKTDGRETLQGGINRSAQYYPMMKKIFRDSNIPEDLIYISIIESGFKTHTVSRADAAGPWQFVPVTARQYGLRIDHWIDERRDPVKSTRAAAEHLKDLHRRFGSWPLALASYNAGSDKVQRAVRESRSKDFWNLHASGSLPRETRDYVPKYMAVAMIASNLPAYGFREPAVEAFTFDEVTVTKGASFDTIAWAANTTYQQIRRLNPELISDAVPASITPYVLRIPKGTKQVFLEKFTAAVQDRANRKKRSENKST